MMVFGTVKPQVPNVLLLGICGKCGLYTVWLDIADLNFIKNNIWIIYGSIFGTVCVLCHWCCVCFLRSPNLKYEKAPEEDIHTELKQWSNVRQYFYCLRVSAYLFILSVSSGLCFHQNLGSLSDLSYWYQWFWNISCYHLTHLSHQFSSVSLITFIWCSSPLSLLSCLSFPLSFWSHTLIS